MAGLGLALVVVSQFHIFSGYDVVAFYRLTIINIGRMRMPWRMTSSDWPAKMDNSAITGPYQSRLKTSAFGY